MIQISKKTARRTSTLFDICKLFGYDTSMQIQLSDHFTYKRLLRFVMSPILMMIFTSIYSVIDGIFVSRFALQVEFASLNFIYPVINVLGAVGFMFGAGGTAIVSKTLGEGHKTHANRYFTLVVLFTAGCGVVLAAIGIAVIRPVTILLKAEPDMVEHCVTYATIILIALPFFMLQNLFQSFFITAEKPKLGFVFTIASGVANIALDAVFIVGCKMGIKGAALGTAISQGIGGLAPIVYFSCKNGSLLRFCKTKFYGRVVLKSCINGSSELLGNISMSLVSMIYNSKLIEMAGQDGVAAFGVIMYVQFIFVAIFIGYCIGVAPIVGYNFGAENKAELQNIFKKSLIVISVTAACMLALSEGLADVIARLFISDALPEGESMSAEQIAAYVKHAADLRAMTANGLRLYSICFAFAGFNMLCSAFFTALNNGVISAVSSFARTLVFQLACIFVLPIFLRLNGIWLSTTVAEALTFVLTVALFAVNNKRYGYIPVKNKATEQKPTC